MNIKFHCDSEGVFKNQKNIRSFVYDNYFIEPHNHDFYEMNIILSGSGIHQIENSTFKVHAGDVFMIPPMVVHAYRNTSNLSVHHFLIHKNFIKNNLTEAMKVNGFAELTEIEPFLRQNCNDKWFLHLSPEKLDHLKYELEFINDIGEYENESFSTLKMHCAWKILYWLSNLLYKQINSNNSYTKHKHGQIIIKSLEYIHHNFNEKITIKTLCDLTYTSRSTFLRSFNEVCGCSPTQYINNYRLKKAAELSENPTLSKTYIAHKCGFYDLSHMERSIKNTKANTQL